MAGRFVVDDTIHPLSRLHAVGRRSKMPRARTPYCVSISPTMESENPGSLAEPCWSAGGGFYTAFCSLDRRPQSATGVVVEAASQAPIDSQPRPTGSIWNIKTTKGLVWLLRVAWVYPTECGLRGRRCDEEWGMQVQAKMLGVPTS